MTRAAFAKSRTGDKCDVLGLNQLFGEFLRRQPARRDIGENVERSARLEAIQTESFKTVVNQPASSVVIGDHFEHVLFAAL